MACGGRDNLASARRLQKAEEVADRVQAQACDGGAGSAGNLDQVLSLGGKPGT